MLILQRRKGEVIHVGPDIDIVLVSLGNGIASIGIQAPKSVDIVRDEIVEKYGRHEMRQKRQ